MAVVPLFPNSYEVEIHPEATVRSLLIQSRNQYSVVDLLSGHLAKTAPEPETRTETYCCSFSLVDLVKEKIGNPEDAQTAIERRNLRLPTELEALVFGQSFLKKLLPDTVSVYALSPCDSHRVLILGKCGKTLSLGDFYWLHGLRPMGALYLTVHDTVSRHPK